MTHRLQQKSTGSRGVYECVYVFVCGGVTVQSNKEGLWHKSSQSFSLSLSFFTRPLTVWFFSPWIVPLKEEAVRTLFYKDFVRSQRNTWALRDRPDCCRSFSLSHHLSRIKLSQTGGQSLCVTKKMSLHLKIKTVTTTWFTMESCHLPGLGLWKLWLQLPPPSISVAVWPR